MAEKIQHIPARLKNMAVGGHVAGAEDIDAGNGKTQQEINADTYRKSETYSKEQLDNMITTPEQEYVTLVAESGDTLEDIFDGVTGAADTIYRVGSWDGTQYNTGAYSEYTWNGEQYVFMSKKEPGIDDEPIPESQKIPNSGGVYKTVQDSSDKFLLKPARTASKREVRYWNDIDVTLLKSVTLNVISNKLNLEDNNVFGLFIKYSDEEETQIMLVTNPSSIPSSIDIVFEDKEVEYIRMSAYNPSGGTISGELVRNTWQQYHIDMLAEKGIIVTEISRHIKDADNVIAGIRLISRGDTSDFYNSDGSVKSLFLRGVNYDNGSHNKAVGIKGEIVPDGAFLYLVEDNLYSGYINSGNILQLVVNNTTTSFAQVDGLKIDFGMLLKKAETEKRQYLNELEYEREKSHQLLPKDTRLDDYSILPIANKVGYWSVRHTGSEDTISKNSTGEGYSVHLGIKQAGENNHGIIINGAGANNSIISLNDIRNKKVTVEFEARLNTGSESASLGISIGGNAVVTYNLTESWKKYRGFLDVERKTYYTDTVTLMLYNPVGDSSIDFSVRNVSAVYEDFDNDFPNAKYKIACLERGQDTQLVIGLLGDSWTQHTWNTDVNSYMPAHSNYVQPLTRYLRDTYGDAGGGLYSFSTSHGGNAKMGCADPDDADDTRGGTIVYRDQVEGVRCVDAADATFKAGSWLRLNVKKAHNKFVVHFYGDSSSGVFTYSIDGNAPVSVDTSEYSGHSTVEIPSSLGTHVISFEVTSGEVMLFGVDMQRNNPGVRVHKIGNKGAFSYSYVNVDNDCWKAMIGSLGMDSLTVLLGINDGDTSFDVGDNLVTIINNVKDVNPYIDTCIISPSNTKTQNFYAVGRSELEAAKKTHSKFIDLIPLFDILNNIYTKGKFYDNYHPTLNGGQAIADKLIEELLPYPDCSMKNAVTMFPYEIMPHSAVRINGTINDNVSYMQIWKYKVSSHQYYKISAYRAEGQNNPVVNWMDSDGNFIYNELKLLTSADPAKAWEEHTVKAPGNACYLFLNIITAYTSNHNVMEVSRDAQVSELMGKTVAVIGDSISTNGNSGDDSNVAEIVIGTEDVGKNLSAYITATDVGNGLTINGRTYTTDDIGTEVAFTPSADDIGKKVGLPLNYNDNTAKVWWEWMKDRLNCNVIPVCWSGASITSHEGDKDSYKASYAWHQSQIRKCGIRIPGSMERMSPDVIIVYRGTNDFSHSPYTLLTDDYFKGTVNYPDNDSVQGGYGFKEGYYKTIAELRKAYPFARIILCTLSPFKRVNYAKFPTNNGIDSLPDYNNAIREIADYCGCDVIEFDKAGITFENMYPTYVSDSSSVPTHPNNYGHLLLGMKAVEKLLKKQGR